MPQVNIPGVGLVNFPYSMSQEEISEASTRLFKENQERTAPENLDLGSKTPEEAAAIAQGRPEGPATVGMAALPQSMAKVMDERGLGYNERVDATLGKPIVDIAQAIQQAVQGGDLTPEQQADVQAWRALAQGASTGEGEGFLNAGTVGELVGGTALGAGAAPLAGAVGRVLPQALARSPVAAGATGGAVGGGAQPVLEGESAVGNTLIGAATGGALPAALSRIARPIPVRPAAAELIDKGITPTVGTSTALGPAGLFFESIENMSSSLMPRAREKAREQAIQIMGERATPPGFKAPDFNNTEEAFQTLAGQYDDAYKSVLSQMQPVNPKWLKGAVSNVTNSLSGRVPRSVRSAITREIEDVLAESQGPVSGMRLKELLTLSKDNIQLAKKSSEPSANSKVLAWERIRDTLSQVQEQLLPAKAFADLQQVNKAFSQYASLRDAAKNVRGIKPESVAGVVRRQTPAAAYARGQGNFRDITNPGASVLLAPKARNVMNVGGGLLTSPVGLPLGVANLARTPLLGATNTQKMLRQALLSETLRKELGALGVGTGGTVTTEE